jgi:hypothetical protein
MDAENLTRALESYLGNILRADFAFFKFLSVSKANCVLISTYVKIIYSYRTLCYMKAYFRTTIDPYAFPESLRLSHAIMGI